MSERLHNRQGLLARANGEIEEEIVIDLSDESDAFSSSSYTSSESNSDDENDRNQDFENNSDHSSIQLDSQDAYHGGQFAAVKNNLQPSKGSSKNKPFWNSEKNLGHVNWSDEVDDTQRGIANALSSPNSGIALKKGRKSSEKHEGFSRRSTGSVDDKWTHDLFEQNENSDGERVVSKSRRGKSGSIKKTVSTKKSSTKQLRLKHLTVISSSSGLSNYSDPSSSSVKAESTPNWAAAVANDEVASKSVEIQKIASQSSSGASSVSEIEMVPSEAESQTPEKIIADLSIDCQAPEMKAEEAALIVAIEAIPSVEQVPSQTDSSLPARPRRVISQASKNQLMASFNRPGGILFRSALTAAGASSPVPRTLSPSQKSASSNTSGSSLPASQGVVEKVNESNTSTATTIQVDSSVLAPKEREPQNTMPSLAVKQVKEQRDLRDTLPLKEFTLKKATTPSKETISNRETPSYQRDKEPRSNRGIRTKESNSKERPSSSRETLSRGVDNQYNRSNSTQDSRDSVSSRTSINSREQNTSSAHEKQPHERFVVEKRGKPKKTVEHVSKEQRRREGNFSKPDIVPEPQQPIVTKDMEPKVVATSTGWALVTPSAVPKAAESGKESRSKRADRNDHGRYDNLSKSSGKYDNSNINANTNNTPNSRSYKSKRQQQSMVASVGADAAASILPYTPAVQPMINVQPMMTQSGHMVLLTEDGLCVPATPGMFQYQQWYDTSMAPPPAAVAANQTYPNYYTENYYASSPSNTK